MLERAAVMEIRYRILVVDDDPQAAGAMRSWYGGQPYTILEARDAEEGLRMAREETPDLILLDVRMPGLDGLSAAKLLKSEPVTKNIPIILLTACRDVTNKVQAFAAGADDYVTKPFAFEEVDARIGAMLRKRELYLALESKNQQLEVTNAQLEELLVVDEKTGLANYRHFHRKLREEWLRGQRYGDPLSVVMLDLDDFKRLNDSAGHPAGDRALKEVATLVAGGARATDVPARYGGEEFAIILPHTDGPMAARVAERILAAVREFAFLADEHPARLTASAGVATFSTGSPLTSPEALVQAADRALYRAKDLGKNRVVVDETAASSV